MIHALHGTITHKAEKLIVCRIGDGMSFALAVADESAFVLNTKTDIYAHVHWNQEQGPALFGFETQQQKELFLLVTSCPGIGPKLALTMLGHLDANQIITALIHNDAKQLSSVPGIGLKKGEQLCFALKSKVEKLLTAGSLEISSQSITQWKELSEALESLKYSRPEIAQALDHLRSSDQINAPFDHLLRKALAFLSKPSL
jgi:Holliday junction DNA helicase RuvA